MNLSPTVAEWAATYEQEHGHKPDELVLQVAEHIIKVSDMLRDRGEKDAQKGEKAYYADDFPQLVRNAFGLDPEAHDDTVQAVADLWRDYYMDGYNAWKEVRSGLIRKHMTIRCKLWRICGGTITWMGTTPGRRCVAHDE